MTPFDQHTTEHQDENDQFIEDFHLDDRSWWQMMIVHGGKKKE